MNDLKLFENKQIRSVWNEEQQEWYFSIVDVVDALAAPASPRRYWSDLKRKLKREGASQLYENIVQLGQPYNIYSKRPLFYDVYQHEILKIPDFTISVISFSLVRKNDQSYTAIVPS